ncbi:hypothetical protein ACYATM_01065 [Lactobacillaceae bacterium Scapto_B20]
MENDYVPFLTDLRDVNMESLSQIQRCVDDGNESRLEPWFGDGKCQLTKDDVTSFFGPVAKAILELIISHDYVQIAMIKVDTIRYVNLRTHTTIFKIQFNANDTFEYDFHVDAMAIDGENGYYFASDTNDEATKTMRNVIQDLTKQKVNFDNAKQGSGENNDN